MNEKTAQFDSHCDALQALHAITKCSLQLAACGKHFTMPHPTPLGAAVVLWLWLPLANCGVICKRTKAQAADDLN